MRASVGENLGRMHQTGHAETKLDLSVAQGMAAHCHRTRERDTLRRASENLTQHGQGEFIDRKRRDV